MGVQHSAVCRTGHHSTISGRGKLARPNWRRMRLETAPPLRFSSARAAGLAISVPRIGGPTTTPTPTATYGRTDYAICVSSNNTDEVFYGPSGSRHRAIRKRGGLPTTLGAQATPPRTTDDYTRSQVKIIDITKGTSNQVMIGEKYLNPEQLRHRNRRRGQRMYVHRGWTTTCAGTPPIHRRRTQRD